MKNIIMLAGSPSASSRSSALLAAASDYLGRYAYSPGTIVVRDLDPQDLIYGRWDGASIRPCVERINVSSGIIVASPVYKAAYAGVLKCFLDILPPNIFAGKIVMPVMTGASTAHFLSLDYALRPVLTAMGASLVTPGIYLHDKQVQQTADGLQFEDAEAEKAWHAALETFHQTIEHNT